MTEQQNPPKNNEIQVKVISNGPVFEAGPGWGVKIKKWFGKYFFKAVLPVVIVVAVIYGIASRQTDNQTADEDKSPVSAQAAISQTINRGDSRIMLARRALAKYLEQSPQDLTKGQKVFIETALGRAVSRPELKTGESLEFKIDDIKTALTKSKELSVSQLKRWEAAAQNVKF